MVIYLTNTTLLSPKSYSVNMQSVAAGKTGVGFLTGPIPAMGGLQIPRWLGSDPLSAWWLGLAPATLEFWVRFPNERNQGKQAHPVLKYRVPSPHGSHHPHRPRLVVSHSTCPPLSSSPPREQLCNRSCSNKHTHTAPSEWLESLRRSTEVEHPVKTQGSTEVKHPVKTQGVAKQTACLRRNVNHPVLSKGEFDDSDPCCPCGPYLLQMWILKINYLQMVAMAVLLLST
jgi:hypothetical protein